MKSVGKGVLSGRDICMLEHLPRLVAARFRSFRVEAISEDPAYRRDVGQVYRQALEQAMGGAYQIRGDWWKMIQAHAKVGFCNGFYFGQSGQLYIGSQPSAVSSQLKVIS
jgi:putative protease